jgi:hypothetical protein
MTDKSDSRFARSRRTALKTIFAAGGAAVAAKSLPERWSKPIVEAVVLPAHAQATASCSCAFITVGVNALANTFTGTYSWSSCSTVDHTVLAIVGPGIDIGYVEPALGNSSGSRTDLVDTTPYSGAFQSDATYTFTLTVEDISNNVIHTCVTTVDTPPAVP